ncbi:MAG: molybdopterin-dependent oxidoreductase [Deltaproteobacteria bacterium]|nr:molybdopterin-dependent oxidoreductase [Deltaproteobacteria bacterium]
MKTVTACTRECTEGCSLIVETGSDGRVSIKGNPDHPITAGLICAKVKDHPRRLSSPNRVLEPRLKDGSGWRAIDWDRALDLCAERIQACRRGGGAILHAGASGQRGVARYAVKSFFRRLGAYRVDPGQICDGAGSAACLADFGKIDQSEIADLAQAGSIVNWGRDLSRGWLHLAAGVARARRGGARVVTISPGHDGNQDRSDRFIRIRPGADRFLAATVIRLLLEQVEEKGCQAANWPAFRDLILAHDPAELVAQCGLSLKEAAELADIYAGSAPTASLIGWGLQRHRFGGQNVRFINALAYLSGNVGRSGGGAYYQMPSLRNLNLGWALDPAAGEQPKLDLPLLGRQLTEADPPVRMLWVNGFNLVNQVPNSAALARSLAGVEFKVVVDAFMTDTAIQADLILPCALMLETEDLVTSSIHSYINYARPVLDPPGLARSDHWIISELGRRLDPPLETPPLEECLRACLDSPWLNVSLDELRRTGFTRADRPAVAYAGEQFGHPDGHCRLPEALNPEPSPPAGYPLRLLSLIRGRATHSQILPEDHPPRPAVWTAPDCPHLAGLDLKRPVYLATPLGRMEVRVETMPGLFPEAIIYRRGDWACLGGGINRLIEPTLTDLGDIAAFYQQHCRLENQETGLDQG